MTTAVAVTGAPPAPPEARGRTEIADQVVERIAVRAVAEVEDTHGLARTLFGVSFSAGSVARRWTSPWTATWRRCG